jgi:hypothetical protein
MTAGDLAVVLAAVLCSIGFAALIVVLLRVLDLLKALRVEVAELRQETRPLLSDLRESVDGARDDLERFDRVLGSAEAISDAMSSTTRVTRAAFSVPVIKTIAFASGGRRAARRLRGKDDEGRAALASRDTRAIEARRGAGADDGAAARRDSKARRR